MTPERLAKVRPELFHLATAGAWAGMARHGLLSASALLDLHGLAGAERAALERDPRPGPHRLAHRAHGPATLRDQRPLRGPALARQLTDGLTPADWCARLNGLVFLFPTRAAADRFAAVYAGEAHDLLLFDTAAVLACAGERVRVATVNSGAPSARSPTPRGPATFRSLAEYDGGAGAVREVVVEGALPGAADLVLRVERLEPGRAARTVWRRGEALPHAAANP